MTHKENVQKHEHREFTPFVNYVKRVSFHVNRVQWTFKNIENISKNTPKKKKKKKKRCGGEVVVERWRGEVERRGGEVV